MKKLWLFLLFGVFPFTAQAAEQEVFELEVYDAKTFEHESIMSFLPAFKDLSFQLADITGEGIDEVIVGADRDQDPLVTIYSASGEVLHQWEAYTIGYRGGVEVAVAEDGINGLYIVTGTRSGGGPHIRVSRPNGEVISQFMAFDPASRSGVTIAAGELLEVMPGPEIVVAMGEGESALVRVYSLYGALISEWYPFGEDHFGGVNVEITPDKKILTTRAFGGGPLVRSFSVEGVLHNEFLAYYDGFPGGVQTKVVTAAHGGYDIYTVPGFSGGPHIRNFSADGVLLSPGFNAFNGEFMGGLVFDEGDIDGDGQLELVVAKATTVLGNAKTIKSIIVDLSEQKMRTYERGELVKEYWISSGTSKYPTPTGEFEVWRKREKARMSWFYGPNNPDNYDLEDVPHAISFYGPYNIHGAYWHNNFGTPMSHGCVNMSLPDAEEVFAFTDMGTTVVVQE